MEERKLLHCWITVVGDYFVGKSSFAHKWVSNWFIEDDDPFTYGHILCKQILVDDAACQVDFRRTRSINDGPPSANDHSGGCILMYSITCRDSFTSIPRLHSEVRRVREELGGIIFSAGYPVVLVGNKTDMHHKRVVTMEEGQELAKVLGCGFYEVSAKTGDNVDRVVHDILRRMIEAGSCDDRSDPVDYVVARDPEMNNIKPVKKKKRCTIL
ncbi:P-loop containing nucleoside triphosphate hydrolase protein [Wilcoxina mikolae CBS 423.85]|nr:P-loop containing nucleoside triphosphate hydrolase protein [Wilcoxina mikolae CBS 423.85]